MKRIALMFSILAFSSLCFADMTGTWHGTLTYNGQPCDPVSIEIAQNNSQLSIKAGDDQWIHCSDEAFLLNQSYGVQGSDLYKYGIKMGTVSDSSILGKERVYEISSGIWRFWDFISFQQDTAGTALVRLNFGDEATLEGSLTK